MELPRLSPSLFKGNIILSEHRIERPDSALFELPERVLQFGSGALIRGSVDYFIDKANKKGIFNGRVVVVKSTDCFMEDFEAQSGLFVHNIRGMESTINLEEYILNCSISRVINARKSWEQVLSCAHNTDLSIVVSNTNEKGIRNTGENLTTNSPSTFPGMLTAFLFERFNAFNGSRDSGMVIVPTELIVDNGTRLKEAVISLAKKNHFGAAFVSWVEEANTFCNSLIDRIVPGMPEAEMKTQSEKTLGFQDELMIASEPYRLWAIEGDASVKEKLSFYKADKSVVIEKNIKKFRERKLRLLNGTHTLFAGLGYLAGFNSVKECMEDPLMSEFIRNVMLDEIVPSLEIERQAGEAFAEELMSRFSNSLIEYPLLKLTKEYSLKMNIRNSRTIINFYKRYVEIPRYISLGFAGFLVFMKAELEEDGKFYGQREDGYYPIEDDNAKYFCDKWKMADLSTINSCKFFVEDIIDDDFIWDKELKKVTGFSDTVAHSLFEIVHKGARETLEELVEFGEIEE